MTPLLEHLYSALHSDLGIVLATDDPEGLRQKLYRERKKDPDLADIQISFSPTTPGQVFLINKGGTTDE